MSCFNTRNRRFWLKEEISYRILLNNITLEALLFGVSLLRQCTSISIQSQWVNRSKADETWSLSTMRLKKRRFLLKRAVKRFHVFTSVSAGFVDNNTTSFSRFKRLTQLLWNSQLDKHIKKWVFTILPNTAYFLELNNLIIEIIFEK